MNFDILHKKKLRLLVVGDIMVDWFSVCCQNRKSAEIDGYILDVEQDFFVLGGAANVYNNLKGFACNVVLAGAVGKDYFGKLVKKSLSDLTYIMHTDYTTVKHRYYVNNKQVTRVDKDKYFKFDKHTYDKFITKIQNDIKNFDAVLISDYNKGFCDEKLINDLALTCKKNNIKLYIDSKKDNITAFKNVYLLKVNEKEFYNLYHKSYKETSPDEITKSLVDNNINNLLLTLGDKGMIIYNANNQVFSCNAQTIENADVIGAGDVAFSSFAFADVAGLHCHESLQFANLCAGFSVSFPFTKSIEIDEFKKWLEKR